MTLFFVSKRKIRYFLLLAVLSVTMATITSSAKEKISSDKEKEVSLPIIMYHSVLKDTSLSGKYTITPKTLEEDLKYLKENGYTSVLSSEIIAFTFPEKPVMITFDDGYLNNLTNVLPLLEKYDFKAVVSVVGKYAEDNTDHNPNYSYLDPDEIKELIKSGRIEIANHTYNLHSLNGRSGSSIIKGEDKSTYQAMLYEDLKKAQNLFEDKASVTPVIFTYPFGSMCESSRSVVESLGFKISLGCAEKVNVLKKDSSLYCLGRFNRPSGISTQEFMKKACPKN